MNVKINVLPESTLTHQQLAHLRVAREVASITVYPADLHNSVKIIGAYRQYGGPIYIAPERLKRLSTTMNTTIHEKAHHTTQADDGTKAHNQAISQITSQVAEDAKAGKYDSLLKGVVW